MRKYLTGLALIMLTVIFGIKAFAVENDYKNNLLKVDVNKTAENNYKIELFTQKPYSEPVRVIKKSDTRYYIFLPETSHSVTSAAPVGNVKSIDVELHPYPGQDLNNGYTRINITTDKPITFQTSVKTASNAVPAKIDHKKLAQLDSVFDEQNKKIAQKPVSAPAAKTITTEKPKIQNTDSVQKETAKTYDSKKQEKPVKIASKPAVKTIVVDTTDKIPQGVKEQAVEDKLPVVGEKSSSVKLEEITDEDLTADDSKTLEQDAKEQGLTEIATDNEEVIPELTKADRIKMAVKKAYRTFLNNIWAAIALLLLVIALILLKESKKKPALKEAADSSQNIAGSDEQTPVSYEPTQITYESPTSSKTYTYELYEVGQQASNQSTFSELTSGMHENSGSVAQAVAPNENTEEKGDEADVLASATITDDKGFCLVNYDGTVSLIGYIEDEIFVLHGFGNISVFNPSIQYRLAEKNEQEAFYIVKTADTKLMVKVTADKMSLEMVM